jgi:uncharacterized membrane protein YkvA (DUF1232 family)
VIKQNIDKLKAWAKRLKSEIYTLYVAMRDPRTPPHAKLFAMLVVGYALSPIDLIPDFIPVLGLLDDLILLPLGIVLLKKLIPPIVMAASRRQADALIRSGLPASRNAAMIVVAIWALVLTCAIWWAVNRILYPPANQRDDWQLESINPDSSNQPTQINDSSDPQSQIPANESSPAQSDRDRGRSRER